MRANGRDKNFRGVYITHTHARSLTDSCALGNFVVDVY